MCLQKKEGGMSMHADVAVPARDRRRLDRLAKYILLPPICLDRLGAQPDGRLSYKLKTQWRDGTTHILMERHELLEMLASYYVISLPPRIGISTVVPSAKAANIPTFTT